MMQNVDGRDVTMHLFEVISQSILLHLSLTQSQYTTHSTIRFDDFKVSVELDSAGGVPCQTIFCLKEKNQKKINSHRWFLAAVCKVLDPTICVFLDAGAIPRDEALYHLWKPLHENPTVAATTGFCTSYVNSSLAAKLNPIVAFQKFEYELTNTLERPVESFFGRRFALNKGGFAAYRWTTASNPDGIFHDYFSAERSYDARISKANSFLVEDRAISASLLHTKLDVWRTVPVDSARVDVDIPGSFGEFCLQRRRWINGDFYSTLHELKHTPRYMSSGKPAKLIRCLGLLLGVVYQMLTTLLQYFAVVSTNFQIQQLKLTHRRETCSSSSMYSTLP
jgi:chitin synthase